jgi:hypothetical protein
MIIHNPILTGSFTVNGTDVSSITSSAANITALNTATASLNTFSASMLTFTASAATTGSNTFVGNQVVTGSLTVTGSITTPGTLTAQTLVVQTITSSVDFVTGSTRFGSIAANTHVFTGSMSVSGSITSDQTDGGVILIKTTGSSVGLLTNTFQISGSGTKSDLNAYVYGGESFGVWTNGTKRLTIDGAGAATFLSSVSVTSELSFPTNKTSGFVGNSIFQNGNKLTIAGGSSGIQFNDNGNTSPLVYITNTGNVGIGTSSPAQKLQIGDGTGTGNQYLRLFNSASDIYLGQTSYNLFAAGNGQVLVTDATYTSNLAIGTLNSSANLVFGTNNAERMRITSGGVVAIGKNDQSGNAALTVKSPAGGNTGLILIEGDTSNDGWGMYAVTSDEYVITRFTNGTYSDKMRITSDGNIGIDGSPTTTTNAKLVIFKDETYSNDVNPAGLIICGKTDSNKRMSMGYDTTNNFAYIVAGNYGVAWTSLYLQKVGGAAYAGSARIDNNSDIRVKDNIQSITGALDTVLSMNGKKFHMLDEPEDKIRLGFIAQELEGVVDELVIHSDRKQILPNGEVVENILGLETWGSSWAALLVEAIKELKAEIDELKNK